MVRSGGSKYFMKTIRVLFVVSVILWSLSSVCAVLGPEFVVSEDSERQMRTLDGTWHAATGQFLVVWSEHPGHSVSSGMETHSGNDEIRGQLVNLDNSLAGGDFLISEGGDSKDFPQVAHIDNTLIPAQQMSLVVWMDDRSGSNDIWGQLISPAGNTKQGSNFKIASTGDQELFPALSYGQIQVISGGSVHTGNGRFLVVWERDTGSGSDIYGQIIWGATTSMTASPGDLIGSNFLISTTPEGSAPSVAFDPVNDHYLVVWTDDKGIPSDNESDIWGRFVDTDGNTVGTSFQISSQSGAEYAPGVIYHPEAQEYLVIWNYASNVFSPSNVYAQRVSPAGALTGGVIDVAVTGAQEEFNEPAINKDTGSYVIPLTTGPSIGNRNNVEFVKLNVTGVPVGVKEQVATDTTENKGPSVAIYGSTIVGPGAGVSATSEVLIAWRDARSAVDDDRLLSQDVYGRMVEVQSDTDGDGLLDHWETNGYVDMNDNGVLDEGDLNFSAFPEANRPDVNHKDIYVEVDWMAVPGPGGHDHAPVAVAGSAPTGTNLDEVITAFANAPVDNPDGTTGINLHLDLGAMGGGGPIPETLNVDFFAVNSFEAVKAANFASERSRVFHYALFKHEGAGRAEIWGNDFWVGGGNNGQVVQAATFMHELGHNLGLRHGGDVNTPNCKPNYFSIMSYAHSLTGIAPGFRLDYSGQALPSLDESNLNEANTLGDGNDQMIFSAGGVAIGPNANTAGNVPIDWDNDGIGGESGANVTNNNINNLAAFSCGGSPSNEVLDGYNDWANIRYNWRSSPHVDDNIHMFHEGEDNTEDMRVNAIALYGNASLSVNKSGTGSGIPGDTVTYTVNVTNTGSGPARNVIMSDSWPAGITYDSSSIAPDVNTVNPDGSRKLVWNIDLIPAGVSEVLTINGTIDYPPASSSVTNNVTVNGQNILGNPVASVLDSQATEILYPEMELNKSANYTVNAGEAIYYNITYENTGTADAENVTLTDTLPANVYYSMALDKGVGPHPDIVEYNADGTTTLSWYLGTVSPNGTHTIEYTARPSLIVLPNETITNNAVLNFTDGNGNTYPEVLANTTTKITEIPAGQEPVSMGFVRNHEDTWTDEILAMIQATDDRYDTNGDGQLSYSEMGDALSPGGNQPKILKMQLLTVYYNLAYREINAGTMIESDIADRLGLENVRDAVIYAQNTLELPVTKENRSTYSDATNVVEEINLNISEVYT